MTVTSTLETTQTRILDAITESQTRALDANTRVAKLVAPRIQSVVQPAVAPMIPVFEKQIDFAGKLIDVNREFAGKLVNAWRPLAANATTTAATKKTAARKPAAKSAGTRKTTAKKTATRKPAAKKA